MRLSDRELLRSIGQDLQQVYGDTLRAPLPNEIKALLDKINQAEFSKAFRQG